MKDILQIAKECFPNNTDEELMELLWNVTCYPFGTKEQVIEDFKEASKASDKDPSKAMAWAEDITNKAMKELNQTQKFAEILGIPEELLTSPESWSACKPVMNISKLHVPGYSIIKTSELEELKRIKDTVIQKEI
jgi:hypothetical protein